MNPSKESSRKKYRKAVKELPADVSTWTEAEGDIYDKYLQYSAVFSEYISNQQQAIADLGASMSTVAEAQIKALNAVYQNFEVGDVFTSEEYFEEASDKVEGYKTLIKVLEKEFKGESLGEELKVEFGEVLNEESMNDLYLTFQKLGPQGVKILRGVLTVLEGELVGVNEKIEEYTLGIKQATVDYLAGAMTVGLAGYKEYIKSYDDYLSEWEANEKKALIRREEEKKAAGVDEIKIAEWVADEKARIEREREVKSKQFQQQVNLERLQVATNFVSDMSGTFSELYDDDKEIQKATIVVSTIANAAMAFGSTFANTKGEIWAKAAMATAASAAVLASGVKAYRQVDSANKGTQLSGGGSSSAIQTGTSAVSSTIIERQIRPVRTTSSTETVLVLSDVEAKQRQQQNVNKVSVI